MASSQSILCYPGTSKARSAWERADTWQVAGPPAMGTPASRGRPASGGCVHSGTSNGSFRRKGAAQGQVEGGHGSRMGFSEGTKTEEGRWRLVC